MPPLKVIVSGGGTGGHIFPAIAIANAVKAKVPEAEILFVGAEGRMEMEKVPAAGYKIEGLWISGLQRRLTVKNLSFPFKVISSLLKARKILRQFKPDVAVGVGGYASGPLLRAAAGKGVPCLIQEQNSFPGITNRLLAGKVQRICVAYNEMERFFPKDKIKITGNPVRKEVVQLQGKRNRGLEYFKLDGNKKTVLVIGGSLGARTINQSIQAALDQFRVNDVQLVWQTGKSYINTAQEAVKGLEEHGIQAHAFITKMDYAYAVADVVISRAGAMSVSELCLVAKPAILVPSPNVAEDHQTKNAMALVNNNAALLVKDVEARETLGQTALELVADADRCEKLSNNIKGLAYHDSAEIIANEVILLAKG